MEIKILPFCRLLLKNPKRDVAMTRLVQCPPLSTSRASRVPLSFWTFWITSHLVSSLKVFLGFLKEVVWPYPPAGRDSALEDSHIELNFN